MRYTIDRVDMKTLAVVERLDEDYGLPDEIDIYAMINTAAYRIRELNQEEWDEDEVPLRVPFHYYWLSGGTVILFDDFLYGENHQILRALFE